MASMALRTNPFWNRPLSSLGVGTMMNVTSVSATAAAGSLAVLADMVKVHGIDSVFVKISAVMYGACETTFYVIAVYFGAVGIKKTRHAVPAGLIADAAGVLLAVYVVKLFW